MGHIRPGLAGRNVDLFRRKADAAVQYDSRRMAETLKFTAEQLTGRTRSHLRDLTEPACSLHQDVVSPFLTLRAAAAVDGIDLVARSSFRDFDRQLAIWNAKFRGERPMQDREGRPLDVAGLTPAQRVEAILWWSALP